MISQLFKYCKNLEEVNKNTFENTSKCKCPEIPETLAFHKGYNEAYMDILKKFKTLNQVCSEH